MRRESKFSILAFGCVCAPVATTSRAVNRNRETACAWEEGAPAERATAREAGELLKSEKNSALENNFSTVAEGENFREAKANFFPEVDLVCVCAPVAIISRAVWKLRNGLRLRGNFEIGKEQYTRK